MMKPLSLGIIGYGGFGRFVHRAWSQMEQVRVHAVSDADSALRPEGVTFYPDWQDLVRDPSLDLVAIVTPPFTHSDIACTAMESGKHVLIEKPLATTREDALRIRSVQEKTGKLAGVDYMLRFNSIVVALQTWCRNGCFGPLRRVVVENYAQDESLSLDHWFWDPARSGGILIEHAVHFIDIVNGCTEARPVRIDGLSVYRNPHQQDRMMATVVYEDGLVASHFHAFTRPNFFEQTTMRFVFDLAQVEIEGWIPLTGRVSALVNDVTATCLQLLPNFQEINRKQVDPLLLRAQLDKKAQNGETEALARIYSSGEPYAVSTWIEGTFEAGIPKTEAYTLALQALMADFVRGIQEPEHRPRVTLEEGWSSLEIALIATERAHRSQENP